MAPYHILIVMISSVIPENLVLLTKSEQSGPKSAHIRPTSDDRVKDKELEKLEKFQLLKDEIAKVWHMQKSHCGACCFWGLWSRISQL